MNGGRRVFLARTEGALIHQGDAMRSKISWLFISFNVAPLRWDRKFVNDRQAVCYENFEPRFGVLDETQGSHGISPVCDSGWLFA